ncbi:hypothetical protein EUGRSUZ_I01999 [Eucalyptus grandis]|uniref:Uncharacterized protein n=2 Tax=Eucalyptus grandis TaxID=71139 RepID=A0ACC3JHA4_EUCGR|nr:hypothetical protein EUGRSUZ_I01999 [Eucalyptus grandis]
MIRFTKTVLQIEIAEQLPKVNHSSLASQSSKAQKRICLRQITWKRCQSSQCRTQIQHEMQNGEDARPKGRFFRFHVGRNPSLWSAIYS